MVESKIKVEMIQGNGDKKTIKSLVDNLLGNKYSFSAITAEDGKIIQLSVVQHYED